jgi:predicted GIY-YIG superfamily endonuclease
MPWVYVLECGDGSLYTGSTNDLQRRIAEHKAGRGGYYTSSHGPVSLAYEEKCETLAEARRREASIKRLPRKRKLLLILANKQAPL